jgi:nicotinate-nucleotide pyrophosphorylase (carboxylating)
MKKRPRIDLDKYTVELVRAALAEDIGSGDITTSATVSPRQQGKARIIAKQDFTLAGISVAELVFRTVNKGVQFKAKVRDGSHIKKGAVIAFVEGSLASILTAERVALNFLQRMSAIATLTSKYAALTKGTKAKILDTRKTTPCLRALEKYSVSAGGGSNHRFGLFDAILIKDNHIKAAGSISQAISKVRTKYPDAIAIEVETRTFAELRQALTAKAEIVMLDNMSLARTKKAMKIIRDNPHTPIIEASGGITLKNIRAIAKTGVDFISIGALTHSAPSVDISMLVD